LGFQTCVCRMPHDKTRTSLPSKSCHFSLDRRRALTLSPEIKRESCQAESPLKIPRRVSTAEDELVDTEMSKDRNKSHSKIHWTQLASNGTSSDQEHTIWKEIKRRQVKVVLEDVLQTEIGQRLLRCGGQICLKTNQSESKRQSDHTSTSALKDKRRTSLTKRGETDSTGPKATSPSHNQTESSSENESCLHKEIKTPKSKQQNSSLKLLESSEVSGNSCSPRERDSPQLPKQTKPSTFEEEEVLLLEGSLQHEEASSSECESLHRPSLSLASRGSLREETSGSEHLPNKKERRETQEWPKYASEDAENHLLRNGEVVQEVDGTRGSVLRLSVGFDREIQAKKIRMDSFSGEHAPNSDHTSGTTEGRSYNTESSKLTPSELIVLSSEEEEEQEGEESKEVEASSLNIQPLEGAKDMNIEDKSSSVVVELQLSSLHMGGVSANCESMKVTTDKITFSLKGSSVDISISTPNVCKYSVWDEPVLGVCGLAKDSEVPPPSLVLFWLSDDQACRLRNELSVILPDTCPVLIYFHSTLFRLIQFPPPPTKGAITVTTEDLECLDSGEFLNDVIIDFYLKYLLVERAPQASVDRSHVFSSFFYKQLTRRDNANEDSTSTPAQVRRHQRVRTWTRHVDIFDKDFLFVPVNQEAHWYLVVICFPGLEVPQYVKRDGRDPVQGDGGEGLGEPEGEIHGENRSNSDEDKDDSFIKSTTTRHLPNCTESTCKRPIVCKRPCILIMDSLKLSVHERIFKLLREYLQVEWETKRGGYRDFSADHMVGSHCAVPLQDNSSDCGLYLLQYAESFLKDPVVDFELPLRLERWFPRQQVRGKREEIRDLILYLYRFQQGSLGHDSLEDRTDHGNVIQ
ncbi:hypothetical protein cypCar_00012643, partial [Cyprinus carpio]